MEVKSSEMESIFTFIETSVRKIMQMSTETSEDKFKVLDARDKLFKIIRDKDPNLKRGALEATCPDMCPEKERLLREYQGRGSVFEMTNFSRNSSFSHSLAVKEYARSSADQEEPLPHELRPISVLTMTMNHLLYNVVDFCELSDDNLEEWYMFVWDRTRAIRKDLTQQGICSLESVALVEQCARFHIHCAERLIDQDNVVYDDKINTENLTKCLQTLKYMYKDLAKEEIKCPNEPEFLCYNLLLNLNNSSVFTELSNISNNLMMSEPVKFALKVIATWGTRNYIRFFNLLKKTTYLNCCLLRRYFGEMRLYAIKTMIRSYCTKNYSPQIPLSQFVNNLNFEGENECIQFLRECNFNFHVIGNETVVNFDRLLFQNPKKTLTTCRAYIFIEEKKQKLLSEIMAGGSLPEIPENYTPQTSFTENGDLKADVVDFSKFFPCNVKNFFSDSNFTLDKPAAVSTNIFLKSESACEPTSKKETEENSQDSFFSIKETNPPLKDPLVGSQQSVFQADSERANAFKNNFQHGIFSSAKNIFNLSDKNQFTKNIFGNTAFSNSNKNISQTEYKTFPSFNINPVIDKEQIKNGEQDYISASSNMFEKNSNKTNTFFLKSNKTVENEDLNTRQEENKLFEKRKSGLQEKLMEKIEVEDSKKRREETVIAEKHLENKDLLEGNVKKEVVEKNSKKEEEERIKKEELLRLEKEEKSRRDEESRLEQLKLINELKKVEEKKQKVEMEYKQKIEKKMLDLKNKYLKWKTKIIFEKWRMKTWSTVEEQKMKDYFKEVKIKYPPVCSEEILDGNPYGLVIPNSLTFEKFRTWKGENRGIVSKKLKLLSNDLPLLKVNRMLGKVLQEQAKSLRSKLDVFPWKLVISVPDEFESAQFWKSIETFIEMHFVDNLYWKFGVEKGPLYCRSGCYESFRFGISIRRLRGCGLYEGSDPNYSAAIGSNALIFIVTERVSKVTQERLENVLKSRSPLPKIPLVIFVFNSNIEELDLRKNLNLDNLKKTFVSEFFFIYGDSNTDQIVHKLIESLHIAVVHSSHPPFVRITSLTAFLSGDWLDCLWRRIEISFSNFKFNLEEPKVLINFFNSCIDKLVEILLMNNDKEYTVLGDEFSEFGTNPPKKTSEYKEKLNSFLQLLKLPSWPAETPKSSHQLNYRIHQYCKKICGQNKQKVKNVKWLLYQIIRKSLLWKGLDIYCNENINEILYNFPWIPVFKEISKNIVNQVKEEIKTEKEFLLMYNLNEIEEFSFESSLIGNLYTNFKKKSAKKLFLFEEHDMEETKPSIEKDSVLYAYSNAIKKEPIKRKREENIEESLDALFSSTGGKRMVFGGEEAKNFNFSEMKCNFQNLNDRLDKIKKQMNENAKMLLDVQSEIE